mgnify:CR=1 FL=1
MDNTQQYAALVQQRSENHSNATGKIRPETIAEKKFHIK